MERLLLKAYRAAWKWNRAYIIALDEYTKKLEEYQDYVRDRDANEETYRAYEDIESERGRLVSVYKETYPSMQN